ncbi:MAG: right-handed parallel beta-helix repeat-containing protein [Microbacteriaceae bacterium]|nr:right-handed parallel beta-helix repeat-containing protein [Microbacteriaceae bacterium]
MNNEVSNKVVISSKHSQLKKLLGISGIAALLITGSVNVVANAVSVSELLTHYSQIGTTSSDQWQATNLSGISIVEDVTKGEVLQLTSTSSQRTGLMHHTSSNTFAPLDGYLEQTNPLNVFSGGSTSSTVPASDVFSLSVRVISGTPELYYNFIWEYTETFVRPDIATTNFVEVSCKLSDDYALSNDWTSINWRDGELIGHCSKFVLANDISIEGYYSFDARTYQGGVEYSGDFADYPNNLDFGITGAVSAVAGIGFSVSGDGTAQFADISVRDYKLSFTNELLNSLTLNPGDDITVAVRAIENGGTIVLNSGTYNLTSLDLFQKSVGIVGVGEVVIQQTDDLGTGKLFNVRGTDAVIFENLTLRGNDNTVRRTTAIDINSSSNIALSNVRIEGFTKNGVSVTAKFDDTFGVLSKNITFNNVSIDDVDWAAIAFYPVSSKAVNEPIDGVVFKGTTSIKNSQYGIQFADSATDALISGADGAKIALGKVVFAGNDANVSNNNATKLSLLDTSTINGKAVSSSDFPGSNVEIIRTSNPGTGGGSSSSPSTPVNSGTNTPPQPQPDVEAGPVAEPPAQDSAGLADLLSNAGVDPEASAQKFDTPSSNPLNNFDPSKPLTGQLPWTGNDNMVDVYAYSTPVFIGSFPVVNGKVQLSNVDLSALGLGDHHLVFIGQSSGQVDALPLTLVSTVEPPTVIPDPVTPDVIDDGNNASNGQFLLWGGLLLVVAIAAVAVILVRKRAGNPNRQQ